MDSVDAGAMFEPISQTQWNEGTPGSTAHTFPWEFRSAPTIKEVERDDPLPDATRHWTCWEQQMLRFVCLLRANVVQSASEAAPRFGSHRNLWRLNVMCSA